VVSLKQDLAELMVSHGAYEVRVANPAVGFEYSSPERHPLAVMPTCKSVVVFIVPRAPAIHYWNLGVRRPEARDLGWLEDAMSDRSAAFHYYVWPVVFLLVNHVSLYALQYLQHLGHRAIDGQFGDTWLSDMVHAKLCAYEAGIGVYGRSGLILHPMLGNRLVIGVILTDAVLDPDSRLEGYEPCEQCRRCIAGCPGGAYGPLGDYHTGWSRERCLSSQPTGIACVECWEACPACRVDEDALFVMTSRYKRGIERVRSMAAQLANGMGCSREVQSA
jgi:epoxyqueuosine reductase QueG